MTHHAISLHQSLHAVLFRRLDLAPLLLCGGASFLFSFQRTTVAEKVLVVTAPHCNCRRNMDGTHFHPSIVMPGQHCGARRGLPLLKATNSAANCTPINFTSAAQYYDCVLHRCLGF